MRFLTATASAFALIGAAILAFAGCSLDFDESKLDECDDRGDGASCAAGQGTCQAGACCTGCWQDGVCRSEGSPAACGKGGAECVSCSGSTNACDESGMCVAQYAVQSIAAGATHTCAGDRMKNLWCWGDNSRGQAAEDLGQTVIQRPRVVSAGEWVDVASAGDADDAHSCAIHFQGSLWCWGDDSYGQAGVDDDVGGDAGVVQGGPATVHPGPWLSITAGKRMSCGILQAGSGGTLWCWGSNEDNRLGLPSTVVQEDTPQPIGTSNTWRSVDAGDGHACAIQQDDTLWCWGDNSSGQAGLAAVGGSEPASGAQPTLIEPGFRQVSAGGAHTCAIRVDDSLWCWGDNTRGQLGLAAGGGQSSPTQIDGPGWARIAAGRAHTCGIKLDGTLWCWGDNSHGQVGTGTISADPPLAPTRIGDGTDWELLTLGADHGCAVTRQGLTSCWGRGDRSQHGVGGTGDVPAPTALTFSF